MFDISIYDKMSLNDRYDTMLTSLEGLISGDESDLTKLCNAAALINALISDLNWCGFYIYSNNELVLGPFQGMPACTKIKVEAGVCGKAASTKETIVVEDVHSFEGHIACDSASNSELVVPIVKDDNLIGVLDLDSFKVGRFSNSEKIYLEKAVEVLNKYINWEHIISAF
ncbi:GAF domain-containing protein [Clostridium oryzae]|uniref:Free methionine-R-sulfoxide reductase n=1 Tax=Clostridium oryzae TaxID=1450648 RepID=A0A1V4IZ31_9CLOT|nr:GAF domain-containing protein [Clostridium oryzae]OPJ65034.1 free methionine-R-sulfoxide reductase [Clostridium oryzae]